jgi:hypothetical protein
MLEVLLVITKAEATIALTGVLVPSIIGSPERISGLRVTWREMVVVFMMIYFTVLE